MMLPPYVVDVHVESPEHRTVRIWLPLFLLWPLLLVIGVLSLVLTALADIALWVAGQSYHRYTFFLLGLFALTMQTRGTSVNIHGDESIVQVAIR